MGLPAGRDRGVSIHAPRFREAMRGVVGRIDLVQAVSIHAPRFREAMPTKQRNQSGASVFQSTPPVSGRRCVAFYGPVPLGCCFNPRPPFPGGDAAAPALEAPTGVVSIHAPRFREAMPLVRSEDGFQ